MDEEKIEELKGRVAALRKEAEALAAVGRAFPAVWRNAERILASTCMIEVNLGYYTFPASGD